ncbi:MAG: hypothetical protein GX897_01905 [Clostridiales bacterium]|jgi:hypothetical protein|nr:hypothetical protein [Clostridiales bacterium]
MNENNAIEATAGGIDETETAAAETENTAATSATAATAAEEITRLREENSELRRQLEALTEPGAPGEPPKPALYTEEEIRAMPRSRVRACLDDIIRSLRRGQ